MRVSALLLVLFATGAEACAGPPAPLQHVPGPSERATTQQGGQLSFSASGEFSDTDTSAIAYNRKLVPEGAQASVTVESSGGKTRTSLVVEGLLPNRGYGAHLHTKPCGRKPDDSGPHYQHEPGKINPVSEVWLDFKTNAEGAANATARNNWQLDPDKLPGSLAIHSKTTVTSGPQAGQAGDRVACLTLH